MGTTNGADDTEHKEAQEYWGYLFKQDRTGTDRLKNLLRGLHRHIGSSWEPSDCPDVTPSQLAHFYRSLNGNYDPLFLSTPSAAIAYIYKNLGCLHSLQPLPSSGGERFSEPTIPALKAEGFVMWQTIQLLLGPEEHAGFLRQAVQKWDIKDPSSGDVFPKILPRSCFPAAPDSHMVNWYEGVSQRLRREAEEEERMRITATEHNQDSDHSGSHRHRKRIERDPSDLSSEEEPINSRNQALAYFRNPLYRTVDGRPGVVRSGSKRPPLTPSGSIFDRGKSVAGTVGNVVRNIGSPHLWDGGHRSDKERERRRRSLPDHHHHLPGEDPPRNDVLRPSSHHGHQGRHSRRGSQQPSPNSQSPDSDSGSPHYSPPHNHHYSQHDRHLRHHRSHEPYPSPREYFPPYEEERHRRRSSAYTDPAEETNASNTGSPIRATFGPSVSPLFATHVARAAARYDSPSRGGVERPHLRDDRRGSDGSPRRSPRRSESVLRNGGGRSESKGRGGQKVTRFDLPDRERTAGGVGGRRYPVEAPWR